MARFSVQTVSLLLVAFIAPGAAGQQVAPVVWPAPVASSAQNVVPDDSPPQPNRALAINDGLLITATDVDGLGDKPVRIESDGTITLPLVGKLRALGLTPEQVEKELTAQFAVYIRSPNVTVKRVTAQRGTIVLAGAFRNPGAYSISEPRTLLDVLSTAGGVQQGAGQTIRITRRLDGTGNPLPFGTEDPEAGLSSVRISLSRLIENRDATQNVMVEPNDVLLAEPPGVVFVSGEVLRPGPVHLTDRDSYGLRELIALAGGFGKDADPNKTKILRPILNGARRAELPIDMQGILDGRLADFRVLADDMVVVPQSKGASRKVKTALIYMVPAALSTLVYVAVRR